MDHQFFIKFDTRIILIIPRKQTILITTAILMKKSLNYFKKFNRKDHFHKFRPN